MQLTKKEKKSIESVLYDLKRTKNYLLKDSTILAGVTSITAMPENTYINKKDGTQIVSFNKHIGNELCYLYNAIERLEYIVNPPVLNEN